MAIIGGGVMGCSAALELADRGARVTLFEAMPELLQRASANGEAKIHLGYVYAKDRGRATARLIARGAMLFAPFFQRHLGEDLLLPVSRPYYYAVHRDSMLTVEEVAAHLRATGREIRALTGGASNSYFGTDAGSEPRRLSASERDSLFDRRLVSAAFETPEIALDCAPLFAALRHRLTQDSRIALRLGTRVADAARADAGIALQTSMGSETFDHVLNAAWAGRLAIDRSMELLPRRDWLFRLKFGACLPPGSATGDVVSTTFVLGPFGDVVRHGNGSLYLSWYPTGMIARSREIEPPDWPHRLHGEEARRMTADSLAGLGALMPGLRRLSAESIAAAEVRGGTIYALGRLDIDRRASALHRRDAIGLTSRGRYHSVDTGKFTMAPYFAVQCADRILG